MKMIGLLLFLLSYSPAYAWYCNDVASERNGDTINACGIGESSDEDVARKTALNNAYKELDLICSRSSSCADRALEIEPLRTDCKKLETTYRCHRGITARITDDERDLQQKTLLEEIFVPKKIIEVDGRESFIKTSIVDFSTGPAGASVYVDGVEVCQTTPCTREINQAEHKILFERTGFDLISKIYVVKQGRQSISEDLIDTYGYLTLEGVPSTATIKINNKEISSQKKIRLNPNQHIVTVSSQYHQPWHKTFEVKRGDHIIYQYDAAPLMAYLKISALAANDSPVEADIYVNEVKIPEKTPAVIQIPSGNATIRLSYSAHKDVIFSQNLDPGDQSEIKQKMKLSNEKDWSFYLGLGWNSDMTQGPEKNDDYSCCIVADLSLQYMITPRMGLRPIFNYFSGSSSTPPYGENASDTVTESNGLLLGAGLPIYFSKNDFSRYFIMPEYGTMRTELIFNHFNAYEKKTETFSQSYFGLHAGIEWIEESPNSVSYGTYFSAGMRKFSDSTQVETSAPTNLVSKIYQGEGTIYLAFGMIILF